MKRMPVVFVGHGSRCTPERQRIHEVLSGSAGRSASPRPCLLSAHWMTKGRGTHMAKPRRSTTSTASPGALAVEYPLGEPGTAELVRDPYPSLRSSSTTDWGWTTAPGSPAAHVSEGRRALVQLSVDIGQRRLSSDIGRRLAALRERGY